MNEDEILEVEDEILEVEDEFLEEDDEFIEDDDEASEDFVEYVDTTDASFDSTDTTSTTNDSYQSSRGSFFDKMNASRGNGRNGNSNILKNGHSNDSNRLQNVLNKNRNQNQSKMNAAARNADESAGKEKKDGVVEKAKDEATQAAEKVAKEAVSKVVAAKTGSGALGKVAGEAAAKLVGPALEKQKKMMQLKLIGILVPIIFFFIVIMIPTIYLASDEDLKTSESESRTNYLYGSGSDSDLYTYLIESGICDNEEECASTQASAFYKELKRVMKSNYNLTEKHADSFIIKMIFYNRTDEVAYAQTAEIQYIANIISSNGSFNISNASSYKEAFVKENGYFDTYRTDLNKARKETIYDEIVKQAETLVKKLEDNAIILSGTTTCSYNVNGQSVSNIKVRLLTCEDHKTATPINNELIDFEKYILGVVYAENEDGSLESYKAQAIAARNYSLLRGSIMGGNLGLTQEDGQWILSIRNCTKDQVYCDPDNGCWSDDSTTGDTVYSGYDSSKPYTKKILSQNSIIRTAVADTSGKILVDASGTIFNTPYKHEDQQEWNSYASEGKDHFQILKLEYASAEKIVATCTSAVLGDFASWKQCGESWSSTSLGSSSHNICSAGCLVTSVSIQIAKSGTTIQNVTSFDPGIFVSYLNDHNGFTGANFYWNSPQNSGIAPNFVYVSNINLNGTQSERTAAIKAYEDQGYYVVIRAKTNQHWVALDHVSGGVVYMHDPASSATKLWDKYPIEMKNGQTLPTRIVLFRNDG